VTPAWNTIAVAAVAGLVVGVASGASWQGYRWSAKYESREREIALQAKETVEHVRELEATINRISVRPAPRRVRCESTPSAGHLPGNPADAGVGGGGPVPPDRDYGPALRECLILQQRVIGYGAMTQ